MLAGQPGTAGTSASQETTTRRTTDPAAQQDPAAEQDPAAQQDPAAERRFAALFKTAVASVGKVDGAAGGAEALRQLEAAAACIDALPPRRAAFARFFVAVWRGEVHLRVGDAASLQKAVDGLLAARRRAHEDGVYKTYYRLKCLIILWQCATPSRFEEIVQGFGDREYLLGKAAEQDAERLIWPLRLLRCDLRLAAEEHAVVEDWRNLSQQVKEASRAEPELAMWHHVCLNRLIWYYLERRDYARARLFVEELPADKARYPRVLIASRRHDYHTVVREGRILALEEDPRYWQLVADAHEALGEHDAALVALGKVLAVAGLGPEDRATALNTEGDCYLGRASQDATAREQDVDRARATYDRALAELANVRTSKAGAERAETFKDLGRVAEAAGDAAKAHEWFQRAIQELQEVRQGIPVDQFGISFLEPEQLVAVDGALRTAVAAGRTPLDALVVMDKLKARDLLDWLAQPPSPRNLAEYRRALRDLAMVRDPGEALKKREEIERLRGTARRLEGRPIPDTEGLLALLAGLPRTLVLSYWVGEEGRAWLGWATAGNRVQAGLLELGTRAEAVRRVGEAYEAVSSPRGDPSVLAAATGFFLPAPVLARLGDVDRVLVCPDANLHRLPFAALPVPGTRLGLGYRLGTVPSLAILRELRARRSPPATRVAILDSVRSREETVRIFGLSPLRFSDREGGQVASSYDNARRLSGSDATFGRLRQLLREGAGTDLLHISAHAVENPLVPSASLLLLGDGPTDMGLMAELRLQGTLVVLSSCQSLGAQDRGGEGVNGLIWGPLSAGARGVVASQWPVNQQATADLMTQFHHFRSRGHGDAEALRRARCRLAESDNYRHPYYWAGFALVAAPGFTPSVLDWAWYVAGLVAPLLLLLLAVGMLLLWRSRRARYSQGSRLRSPLGVGG